MKRSSRPRTAAELPKSLSQQLNAYALAAGAAGVSALALAQPAEAKIVYTPAHVKLVQGPYNYDLDLNHDRQTDFSFPSYGGCDSGCSLSLRVQGAVGGNKVIGTKPQPPRLPPIAVAVRAGAQIGPGRHFYGGGAMATVVTNTSRSSIRWYGQWGNGGKGLKNRYLGLKFQIKGKTHFGWARVTVKTTINEFTATLTGYAYETIPGKAIVAGRTKGPDVTTVYPVSLGHLAASASAVPAWRVKQTAATTH